MVEFDVILEKMGKLSRRQWTQLGLLMLPCMLAASQMGAMVYLGADIGISCKNPVKEKVTKKCNQTWNTEQELKLFPWNEEKNGPSSCYRYNLSNLPAAEDCSYWWDNLVTGQISTNQSSKQVKQMSKKRVVCTDWIYNSSSLFLTSVVSEFHLVCSQSYKRHLSQAIFMLGVTIGCTFWGQISDRHGRKVAIVLSALFGTIFAIAVAFSNSYILFVALRSLSGSCLFPSFMTSYVLATEIVRPQHRVRSGQTCQALFALGFCTLALYGFLVREWRKLQLVLSLPILAISTFHWLLFESPRWLISRKRFIDANAVVQMLMKSLGRNDIAEVDSLEEIAEGTNDEERTNLEENMEYGPMDLVRTPNIRSKSLKLFYCWLVCSCVYYGLTLNAADLGGDPFINLFLSGFVEIPAVFICIPMLERWGRRPSLAFTLVLSGVACVAMLFIPQEMLWLNISLSMLGKFAIAAAFGTVYIYAAELYPTPIRNVGIGVCSSSARIGGIMSPFVAMLSIVAEPLPYVVFGAMAIFGGILALFLPEVLGTRLPETLREGEDFGKDQTNPMSYVLKKIGCRKNAASPDQKIPEVRYKCVAEAEIIA